MYTHSRTTVCSQSEPRVQHLTPTPSSVQNRSCQSQLLPSFHNKFHASRSAAGQLGKNLGPQLRVFMCGQQAEMRRSTRLVTSVLPHFCSTILRFLDIFARSRDNRSVRQQIVVKIKIIDRDSYIGLSSDFELRTRKKFAAKFVSDVSI